MTRQTVLLLGATGETGTSLLNGLLADGDYAVTALIREASLEKPSVKALKDRGVAVLAGDASADVTTLTQICEGFDIVLSAVGPGSQLAQLNLVDAAAAAGVKRFVPCGWTTISPRGGIMTLRDEKEEVQDRVLESCVPYTLIDCGFWHILSFPTVPSGKLDYASFGGQKPLIYGTGDKKSLLSHLPDIGRWTAQILKDDRTLNKRVVIYSDNISQREVFDTVEEATGEEIEGQHVTAEELQVTLKQLRDKLETIPSKDAYVPERIALTINEYNWSKYIRGDNSLENARELGYLDAKELYPDFKPVTFREFIRDVVLTGNAVKPYASLH